MTEIGPIDIKLTASGISDVLNAFKSVEDRAVALERKLDQISQAGSRKRVKTAKSEADDKSKSNQKAVQDHDKSEQSKTQATDKWAKQRERIIHNSAMMAGRLARQQADQEIREAERSANARATFSRQLAGKIVNDFRSILGHATRIFGAITALGGGLSVHSAFAREMAISREAQNTALVTHVPGKPGESVSADTLIGGARQIAKQFNVHPEDVLSSQRELMSKSSMGTSVLGLTPELIKLAKAENTGQDPKEFQDEIFRAAGVMIKQGAAPNHVMTMLRGMVGQGRSEGGTTEFSEMAKILPRLTSKAALFEGNQEGNMLKMTGLFQAGFKATGSIGEGATAVERLTDDLLKRDKSGRSKVEKFLGHSITRGGKVIGPEQLLPEIFEKSGGDIGKLENAGLNVRSNRLLLGYLNTFQKAEKEKAGSGGKAVHEEIMKTATAALSKEEVDKDYAERQQSIAEKTEKVWNDFDAAIREKLIPVVTDKLIPALEKVLPAFSDLLVQLSKFIEWASKHPWETLFIGVGAIAGKALGTAIAAEVAKAGIAKLLGGGGAGGMPGMGGIPLNAAAGGPGTAGAILAGATIGIGTGLAVVANVDSTTDRDKAELIRKQEAANKALISLGPNAKQEDIAKAKATLASLDANIKEQQSFFSRWGKNVGRAGGFITGDPKSEAGDLLNIVPLFGAYNAMLGGSAFGGAEQQTKLAETQRDQLDKAIKNAEQQQKAGSDLQNAASALKEAATTLKDAKPYTGPGPGHFGGGQPGGRGAAGSW